MKGVRIHALFVPIDPVRSAHLPAAVKNGTA